MRGRMLTGFQLLRVDFCVRGETGCVLLQGVEGKETAELSPAVKVGGKYRRRGGCWGLRGEICVTMDQNPGRIDASRALLVL